MKKPKKTSDHRRLMDRLIPDPSLGHLLGILATTYEMQPEFFETDFLPTVFGLGGWDDRNWTSRIALEKHLAELDGATVLLDAHPYRGRPRSLRVEVKPIPLEANRSLHAKVLIGVYEEAIRLIVGSANLTEPGYRRNREVVAVLTASAKHTTEAQLVTQSLREMRHLVDQWLTPSARKLLELALGRLEEWALENADAEHWFAWGGGARPLWRQFLDRWPTTDTVERITIVSPFWSEERAGGPITTFVTALQDAGSLTSDAELRLLTEAAPDKQTTYMPKLPESFRDFDARSIGIEAKAWAVDPRVPAEEVDMGDGFTGVRSLHAKVVLLEGSATSLAYLGSANFTRHGWGFLSDPHRSNIEAGLILRRTGSARAVLLSFVPSTTGSPVPLFGAAAGRLALPDPSPDEPPWPSFLREVLLAPSETNPEKLELLVIVADDEVAGSWQISECAPDGQSVQTLLTVDEAKPGRVNYRIPLSDQALVRLLREQEVHIVWWRCAAGRSFPINVAPSARMTLPISPGTGRPEEQHLIAYYQGRISWEDLFPDPEGGGGSENDGQEADKLSNVDTSRIQSYIVREFVEALKGIGDDLKNAAKSPKGCMRLALLGSVSPVALATRIAEAAGAGERTPTASCFQLVEILGCLDAARHFEASARLRDGWLQLVDEAVARVTVMLANIQERFHDDNSGDFRRYARTVRQHHLGQTGKR